MSTTIQKWGNSAGVRIPKHILDSLSLGVEDSVSIVQTHEGILITKTAELTFAEKCKRITKQNVHGCVEWGHPIGNEVW